MKNFNSKHMAIASCLALLGACFVAPEASATSKPVEMINDGLTDKKGNRIKKASTLRREARRAAGYVRPTHESKKSLPVANFGGNTFAAPSGKATGSAPANQNAVGGIAGGTAGSVGANGKPAAGMVAAGGGNMVAAGGGNAVPTGAGNLRTPGNTPPANLATGKRQ